MFDVVHLYALLSDMGLVPANVGSLLFDPQLFALLAMMLAMMLYTGRSFSNSHRLTADLNMQLANLNETLEQRIDQKTADLLDAYERLKQERMK